VLRGLAEIVHYMQTRSYQKANDSYLRLSIGTAAWPIGVTSVGIHERSSQDKLYVDKIAHVLNDEVSRKWIQAVKRYAMAISFVLKTNEQTLDILTVDTAAQGDLADDGMNTMRRGSRKLWSIRRPRFILPHDRGKALAVLIGNRMHRARGTK